MDLTHGISTTLITLNSFHPEKANCFEQKEYGSRVYICLFHSTILKSKKLFNLLIDPA